MRALPVAAEVQEAEHVHRVGRSSTRVSGREVEPVNVLKVAARYERSRAESCRRCFSSAGNVTSADGETEK